MNNKIDRDKIRQELVRKFEVIITDNDPIWNWVALHNVIIDQYVEMAVSNFDTVQLNLDAIYERHTAGLKTHAEHYAGQLVNAITKEHANINNGVAVEMEKQRKLMEAMINEKVGMLQKWMWVSLVAAVSSVVGLLLMFVLIKFF